jgi:hypothetical protein
MGFLFIRIPQNQINPPSDVSPKFRYKSIENILDTDHEIDSQILDSISYSYMSSLINYLETINIPELSLFIDTFRDKEASNGVIFSSQECLQIINGIDKIPNSSFDRILGTIQTCFRICFIDNYCYVR